MVGYKPVAGEPGPVEGVFALFDLLLRRAPPIVEVHHILGPGRHGGDDDAHPREQFSPVPFPLGHDPPWPVPAPRLIRKGDGLSRRSPHRALQQVLNLPLQHLFAGEPDDVEDLPLFQVRIDFRAGKGYIGSGTGALRFAHSGT